MHQTATRKLQSKRVMYHLCQEPARERHPTRSEVQELLDGWIPPKVLFFPAALLWLQFCGLISKVKRKWAWDKIKLRSTMGQFLQASCQAAEEGVRSSTVAQATGLLFMCEDDFILGFCMNSTMSLHASRCFDLFYCFCEELM